MQYARAKSLRFSDIRIINDVCHLRGLRYIKVRLVGTYWKRPEWYEMKDYMNCAGITTEQDNTW